MISMTDLRDHAYAYVAIGNCDKLATFETMLIGLTDMLGIDEEHPDNDAWQELFNIINGAV